MNTEQRITALESRILQLEKLLETQDISAWQSPVQAALALGVSRGFLIQEIARVRINPKTSDFKEGIHFRHAGRPGAARPTWQINVPKFREVLSVPIEKRKGA